MSPAGGPLAMPRGMMSTPLRICRCSLAGAAVLARLLLAGVSAATTLRRVVGAAVLHLRRGTGAALFQPAHERVVFTVSVDVCGQQEGKTGRQSRASAVPQRIVIEGRAQEGATKAAARANPAMASARPSPVTSASGCVDDPMPCADFHSAYEENAEPVDGETHQLPLPSKNATASALPSPVTSARNCPSSGHRAPISTEHTKKTPSRSTAQPTSSSCCKNATASALPSPVTSATSCVVEPAPCPDVHRAWENAEPVEGATRSCRCRRRMRWHLPTITGGIGDEISCCSRHRPAAQTDGLSKVPSRCRPAPWLPTDRRWSRRRRSDRRDHRR